MDIQFSKKYQPLFNLLKKDIPELKNVSTVLLSGGRDSGKTFGLSCFAGVAATDYNHRILYTRQTMASTNNSIKRALENRLELLKIADDFTFANNDYTANLGKGLISITGQKTASGAQTAKLKSIEDYSMFITDEGEELTSLEEWKKVKRSIRAQDVRCISIISFNPPTKAHWLFNEFYKDIPLGFCGVIGEVLYIHTTYLDNGKDNMAPHNWNEYERLREAYEYYNSLDSKEQLQAPHDLTRDYKEYYSTILGGFRDVAEGVIFKYTISEFVSSEYSDLIGADQGFTHPSAFIKVNVDKDLKKIYLKEMLYSVGKTEDEIYSEIKEEAGYTRIWCDSAAPLFIRNLRNKGLNIRACKKPKIFDSLMAMMNYELIVDPKSTSLQREFDNYRWSSKQKDVPIDDWNHGIDAARYAISHKLNEKIAPKL